MTQVAAADFTDVLQKMKYVANNDNTLYSLIQDRFYPRPLNVEGEEQYPLINCHLFSTPINQAHKRINVKTFIFDTYYVSEESIDECTALYNAFYAIINNTRHTLDTGAMTVIEDSGVMDVSGIFGDKTLYILTNSWETRKL